MPIARAPKRSCGDVVAGDSPPVFGRLTGEPDRSYARAREFCRSGGFDPETLDVKPRWSMAEAAEKFGLTVTHTADLARRWQWRKRCASHDQAMEAHAEQTRFSSGRWIEIADAALRELASRDLSEIKTPEIVSVVRLAADQITALRERETMRPVTLPGIEAEDLERVLSAEERAVFVSFLRRIRDGQAKQ